MGGRVQSVVVRNGCFNRNLRMRDGVVGVDV